MKESRMLISAYKMLFFSYHEFASSRWGGRRTSPHIWAISYLCFVSTFLFMSLELELQRHGYSVISAFQGLEWVPGIIKITWPAFLIAALNFSYFLIGGKWKSILNELSAKSAREQQNSHFFSLIVTFLVFSLFLLEAWAYENARFSV